MVTHPIGLVRRALCILWGNYLLEGPCGLCAKGGAKNVARYRAGESGGRIT